MPAFMLLAGILCGALAYWRGRNPVIWFVVGMFMTLFGVLLLLILPDRSQTAQQQQQRNQDTAAPEPGVIDVTPAAPPEDPGFAHHEWYYVDREGEQQGPVSFAELKQLWERQDIGPRSYVWCEALSDWQKIAEYSSLEKALR